MSYQVIYDKAKSLIKADVCMKFYDETKPLYLESDALWIGLGATLLQTRDGTTCPKDIAPGPSHLQSKSLTSPDHRYSNIKRGNGYTAWA